MLSLLHCFAWALGDSWCWLVYMVDTILDCAWNQAIWNQLQSTLQDQSKLFKLKQQANKSRIIPVDIWHSRIKSY
jgi:hypothetical protein